MDLLIFFTQAYEKKNRSIFSSTTPSSLSYGLQEIGNKVLGIYLGSTVMLFYYVSMDKRSF